MNIPFYIEQVNPNDSTYKLISCPVANFTKIYAGDLLLQLEGQKTIIEVFAEKEGYFYTQFMVGDNIIATDIAYFISDTHEECLILSNSSVKKGNYEDTGYGLPLRDLLPTEQINIKPKESIIPLNDPMIRVAILPGGRAFRQIQDAVDGNRNLSIVGYFDDANLSGPDSLGIIDFESILKRYKNGEIDRIFVATGNCELRTQLINKLARLGLKFINIYHPSAFISNDAVLGSNIYVGPFAQVASKATVEDGVFVSASANIDHHCFISENSLLGPGVHLSGGVKIGKRSVLGAGVSVEANIVIGDDVYITSGKGINKNIKDNTRLLD